MFPLYLLTLVALAVVNALFGRRAGRLEKRFAAAALDAEKLAKQFHARPGNGGGIDLLTSVKRQFELARAVQYRDRLEAKYLTWQARADRLGHARHLLTAWKGRATPYLMGVVDVSALLVALHLAGLPHGLTTEKVREFVAANVRK